jgi:hypothetical protein
MGDGFRTGHGTEGRLVTGKPNDVWNIHLSMTPTFLELTNDV